MSTIKANAYLDAAGGNTATINGATPVGTDTVQTLTNKSIDAGQLTGDVAAARITTALNASGSAPIYACRAWVNFSGVTPSIRASGNVSSITRNSVGDYTVNFTTALPDANYAVITGIGQTSSGTAQTIRTKLVSSDTGAPSLKTTTQVELVTGGLNEMSEIYISVFR